MQRRGGASKKGKDTEEEQQQGRQEARPRMEAPRGSTIAWIPAQTAVLDQTTTSKMEVETEGRMELEKLSVGKTAEINMQKGLELGIKTDSDKTAPVEMKPQIEGGAHISKEGIKIHSRKGLGLKSPGQNLNRIQFTCTNPTPGSKRGVQRSREGVRGGQKDQSQGTEVMMEASGRGFFPSLAPPPPHQTRGR